MAKNDYYTIVAKILVYLYKKYKCMHIDEDYISPVSKDFPIPEKQLEETILMMMEQGLISGSVTKAWGGDVVMIDYRTLKIKPAGIDYLQDNSKVRKICKTLIEAEPIWSLFI